MGTRRAKGGGCGCLSLLGLGLAVLLIIGAVQALNDPASLTPQERATVWWVIAILSGLVVLGVIVKSTRPQAARRGQACDLCGCPIGRKVYTATVEGTTKRMCANCGRRIAA